MRSPSDHGPVRPTSGETSEGAPHHHPIAPQSNLATLTLTHTTQTHRTASPHTTPASFTGEVACGGLG
jgi:hypothetical protein